MNHRVAITNTDWHGYPYRARCTCGWVSMTYAAEHAARYMADEHTRGVS